MASKKIHFYISSYYLHSYYFDDVCKKWIQFLHWDFLSLDTDSNQLGLDHKKETMFKFIKITQTNREFLQQSASSI